MLGAGHEGSGARGAVFIVEELVDMWRETGGLLEALRLAASQVVGVEGILDLP